MDKTKKITDITQRIIHLKWDYAGHVARLRMAGLSNGYLARGVTGKRRPILRWCGDLRRVAIHHSKMAMGCVGQRSLAKHEESVCSKRSAACL